LAGRAIAASGLSDKGQFRQSPQHFLAGSAKEASARFEAIPLRSLRLQAHSHRQDRRLSVRWGTGGARSASYQPASCGCRHALVAGRFQIVSGTGSGRRLRSMNWRNSLTTGHGRANRRMLSAFLAAFSVTRMAIWIRLPSMLPSITDDVSPVEVLEFLHVPGHPIASECCLKDLGYNGVPTDLIAGCPRIGE